MARKTLLNTSVWLICFVLLSGCKEEKPKDIISENEMIRILLEVYLGESKVSGLNVKRDSALIIFEEYENRLFEEYSIDRERYKKSLSYYYDNPIALERIYDGILDSLNVREQRMKEQEKEQMEKKYNSKGDGKNSKAIDPELK